MPGGAFALGRQHCERRQERQDACVTRMALIRRMVCSDDPRVGDEQVDTPFMRCDVGGGTRKGGIVGDIDRRATLKPSPLFAPVISAIFMQLQCMTAAIVEAGSLGRGRCAK